MPLEIKNTNIAGLLTITQQQNHDDRGYFINFYRDLEFVEILGPRSIRQVNQSGTLKSGTIRGMHFQYQPHAECKLIRCIRGRVWDVAVDLRKGSSTFMKWHAEILDDVNTKLLFIPEGFAHGYQTLEDNTDLLYLHTGIYDRSSEGGCNPFDVSIGIKWPLEVTNISARDKNLTFLNPGFQGI